MTYEELARELAICIGTLHRGPAHKVVELSKGEMAMMICLLHMTGERTPMLLCQKLNISTARVANTLNSLEKKQYIIRTHDREDRRKVLVDLTEAGRTKVSECHNEMMADLTNMLKTLGEKDAIEYVRLNKKVVAILKERESE